MKYLKYFEAMEFTSHFAGLVTQYNGEKFTLSGGQRVNGGLNVGEKSYHRLKYIIYSNELFQQSSDLFIIENIPIGFSPLYISSTNKLFSLKYSMFILICSLVSS